MLKRIIGLAQWKVWPLVTFHAVGTAWLYRCWPYILFLSPVAQCDLSSWVLLRSHDSSVLDKQANDFYVDNHYHTVCLAAQVHTNRWNVITVTSPKAGKHTLVQIFAKLISRAGITTVFGLASCEVQNFLAHLSNTPDVGTRRSSEYAP